MGKDWFQFRRASQKWDNHNLVLVAEDEVTYEIYDNGADSVSTPYTIYFNMEREAIGVSILLTAAVSLTEINGRAFKSPRTLNVGNNKLDGHISSFKIVTSGSAVVEVMVK